MLIVDAQIHIWTGHKPANPNHRQILDFTAADVLKEMDDAGVNAAVIHPPGWDPNSNALAVEAARQHPNRFAILANFPLDKPDSRPGSTDQGSARGTRAAFRAQPAAPEDLAHRRQPRLAVARGRTRRHAGRADRRKPAAGVPKIASAIPDSS